MIKTQDFETTWREFVATWRRARVPLGNVFAILAERAKHADPCAAEPAHYQPDGPARMMVRLCRELARSYNGAPFPLSSHSAYPVAGLPNHRQALDTLRMLVADGVLELVEKGNPKKKLANVYRWLPPLD